MHKNQQIDVDIASDIRFVGKIVAAIKCTPSSEISMHFAPFLHDLIRYIHKVCPCFFVMAKNAGIRCAFLLFIMLVCNDKLIVRLRIAGGKWIVVCVGGQGIVIG